MPTPQEIEAAAGIQPADELDRKRTWAAAQALAARDGRAPSAEDLRLAQAVLDAARTAGDEHLSENRGRAIITFTDTGRGDEVDIAVEFVPQLEELGAEEVGGTAAQLMALELLESAFGDHAGHDHGPGGDAGHDNGPGGPPPR